MAPKSRLTPEVIEDHRCLCTERGIGVNNGSRQPKVQLRVGFSGIDLSQEHLVMGPGQFESTVLQMLVPVFMHQAFTCLFCRAYSIDHVDSSSLARLYSYTVPDSNDGVEHCSLTARKLVFFHCQRACQG